jgi:hypothetical protein
VRGTETDLEKELKDLYSKFPSMYELLPDNFYLDKKAMVFSDGQPIHGTDNTYLNNQWKFKVEDMRDNVNKAMAFKKGLGEKLPGKEDDILVIFARKYLLMKR